MFDKEHSKLAKEHSMFDQALSKLGMRRFWLDMGLSMFEKGLSKLANGHSMFGR